MQHKKIIEIESLSKSFRQDKYDYLKALNNISINFYSGEWAFIIGGNGSGKTTLLRTIYKDYKQDEGALNFSHPYSDSIFFVEAGSHNDLVPSMTIFENLQLINSENLMFPSFSFYKKNDLRTVYKQLLKKFELNLEKRLDTQISSLSSGQQQAIAATKMLLSGKGIILLDEFTSALDNKIAPIILSILKNNIISKQMTVIAVTHDYQWINDIGDRVIIMDNGIIRRTLIKSDSTLNNKTVINDHQELGHPFNVIPSFKADVIMGYVYD